jgi:predicted nuclease of restriction endonuclease-like RecB superfamily
MRIVCGPACRGKIARKGAILSESTKAKLSAAAVIQNKKYKSNIIYIHKNGSEIFMKSHWEAAYARWLDLFNIAWQYEPEFKLQNGKIYLPDFLLEDGSVVEIKGYFRPDAKVKWDMFCEEYPNIKKSLLQKNQLQELGII